MSHSHCLAGLRAARTASNISAEDIAARLGVTPNTYHRYEAGTRRIYFDKACVAADMLGVSLDELRHVPAAPSAPDTVEAAARLDGWEIEG